MEGDFFNENEIIINKALIRQGKNAAINILDYFIINAICFSAVERIIGLPQGSIKQWSEKEILSPAEMAILRLVRAFPDLLEKIDNKINKKERI